MAPTGSTWRPRSSNFVIRPFISSITACSNFSWLIRIVGATDSPMISTRSEHDPPEDHAHDGPLLQIRLPGEQTAANDEIHDYALHFVVCEGIAPRTLLDHRERVGRGIQQQHDARDARADRNRLRRCLLAQAEHRSRRGDEGRDGIRAAATDAIGGRFLREPALGAGDGHAHSAIIRTSPPRAVFPLARLWHAGAPCAISARHARRRPPADPPEAHRAPDRPTRRASPRALRAGHRIPARTAPLDSKSGTGPGAVAGPGRRTG